MSDEKIPGAARPPQPRRSPRFHLGLATLAGLFSATRLSGPKAGYGGAAFTSGNLSVRLAGRSRNGRQRWKKLRATGYVSMRPRRKRKNQR